MIAQRIYPASVEQDRRRTRAELTSLIDTQHDLQEALNGLNCQLDAKLAELQSARHRFEETSRAHHVSPAISIASITSTTNSNLMLAEASLDRLHIRTITRQVEYLEARVASLRSHINAIKDEIAARSL